MHTVFLTRPWWLRNNSSPSRHTFPRCSWICHICDTYQFSHAMLKLLTRIKDAACYLSCFQAQINIGIKSRCIRLFIIALYCCKMPLYASPVWIDLTKCGPFTCSKESNVIRFASLLHSTYVLPLVLERATYLTRAHSILAQKEAQCSCHTSRAFSSFRNNMHGICGSFNSTIVQNCFQSSNYIAAVKCFMIYFPMLSVLQASTVKNVIYLPSQVKLTSKRLNI